MLDESYVLIPGIKTYKAVNLKSGTVTKISQPKNISDRVNDIMILENSNKSLLFRIENFELTFFLTSRCNQRCIMCPQKLDIDTTDNDLILQRVIDNLDYDVIKEVSFTGGEPLLKMKFIEELLQRTPEKILFTILTNCTIMPSEVILKSHRCKLCVPLYAPFDVLHNRMTGSSMFYRVVENLMRISKYEISIELRFVITKLNSYCLEEYARFVWRNLPFVQDVAFMGLELTAEAAKNKAELWINPADYVASLKKALEYLDGCGISSWVYNLPFCFFDGHFKKFLVKSISPWKIRFLPICESCTMKTDCGGMFFSDVTEFKNILVPVRK